MARSRTRVVDATLREGNQACGVRFTVEDSIAIAQELDQLGVDTIEIGHPLAGVDEHERTRAVAELKLNADVLAHARAHADDIRAVAAAGADWVGVFLGVNDITSRARVIGRGSAQLVEMVTAAVKVAKDAGLRIRYSCEDASRTSDSLLVDVFGSAIDAGADRICYADTIGHAEPQEIAAKVTLLRSAFPGTEVEVHLHDDRGLAMASALAAIDAGASWVSACVNGLGERCGITELAALLVNLGIRGERPLPDLEALRWLSRLVAAQSGIAADPLRPVVGENAFKHGSKLHVRATSFDPRAYDWIKEFVHRQSLETASRETVPQGSQSVTEPFPVGEMA